MTCTRCGQRPASVSKGDGYCPQCRHYLAKHPAAETRPTAYGMRLLSEEERFWAKVAKTAGTDGCWLWTGHLDEDGYGRFRYEGSDKAAYRYAYRLLIGPIPEGLELDHLCRVRACVNPDHLEPVTTKENIARGEGLAARNSKKTHCKYGHEYTPDNTITQRHPDGRLKGRECRQCKRERLILAYRKQKGQV